MPKKKQPEPSHKAIMWLIYMRTILELCIKYDDNGNIKEHVLTPTGWIIYNRIRDIETSIYNRSEKHKQKYLEAHALSKPVWKNSLEVMGESYSIYIEPIVTTLYAKLERELTALGLIYAPFGRMYDLYFEKYQCDLEQQSVAPVDVIVKETEKALFEFKKQKKRGDL